MGNRGAAGPVRRPASGSLRLRWPVPRLPPGSRWRAARCWRSGWPMVPSRRRGWPGAIPRSCASWPTTTPSTRSSSPFRTTRPMCWWGCGSRSGLRPCWRWMTGLLRSVAPRHPPVPQQPSPGELAGGHGSGPAAGRRGVRLAASVLQISLNDCPVTDELNAAVAHPGQLRRGGGGDSVAPVPGEPGGACQHGASRLTGGASAGLAHPAHEGLLLLLGGQSAVVHDDDPVGHIEDFVVMGDHDDRGPVAFGHLLHHGDHGAP